MSVSQVIAGRGGSLNRGSHLSGDTCHMMPRSLARRAVREGPAMGPHRTRTGLAVGYVGRRRRRREARRRGRRRGWWWRTSPGWGWPGEVRVPRGVRWIADLPGGLARLVPTPMGTSRPVRGVSFGGGPTAFGRPSGAAAPRRPAATSGTERGCRGAAGRRTGCRVRVRARGDGVHERTVPEGAVPSAGVTGHASGGAASGEGAENQGAGRLRRTPSRTYAGETGMSRYGSLVPPSSARTRTAATSRKGIRWYGVTACASP